MTVPRLEPSLTGARIVPVLVLDNPAEAVPLAEALVAGGLTTLEITLRTPGALACAEAIAAKVPGALVGLGTLIRPEQFAQARDVGARFVVSPGLTDRLAEAAKAAGLPYLPGIATVTEALIAYEHGFRELKFFPAMLNGGAPALRGMAPLLPEIRFCPTGGIKAENVREILSLPNVFALGGTWLTPADAVKERRWAAIERLAREASTLATQV
ncbi:bifunctional 4-hydroxy-2-oxoglutarate aldolase/2-dehydro-3-deoxy-phosphogluconate aldolase [Azospirillum canadense]|uniref:bifunctional 4-hydroxy-2-oxoglutarate aldolase/2-dehydro-3-deoxy-phosphogluconate aldolase n=1 Tax=Azospirillum canadense TaxID=403962 RepID=UPI002226F7E8|nr:bifunctional 4-hydroxy-2-oxoglutarate aldolase/2-dehydro-3-deoxy-phosphogluconate aldolase [Azospirillum canadense]MCW2243244.1 2-dehydro-3-deoxyphosphogluconate aldolase/(4S)-4-hydroxy-2-oxoglutarate aldolase [Azospirillum canadense]